VDADVRLFEQQRTHLTAEKRLVDLERIDPLTLLIVYRDLDHFGSPTVRASGSRPPPECVFAPCRRLTGRRLTRLQEPFVVALQFPFAAGSVRRLAAAATPTSGTYDAAAAALAALPL
jgi:hypothetical protein